MGADLCGIAPIERFDNAPKGFKSTDIYEECKSVLVFAKGILGGSMNTSDCILDTHVNNVLHRKFEGLCMLWFFKDEYNIV